MPRPPWWSPYDNEGGAECKDPAFVDTILDTNVCFVDTPGHDSLFKVSPLPICSCAVGPNPENSYRTPFLRLMSI